jgi:hypothetical protein
MKTRLTIGIVTLSLLVTLANYTTSAQVNKSIVDTTKVWYDGQNGRGIITYTYKFGKDTIVNNKQYRKLLYAYNSDSDFDFKDAQIIIREDSNRVYFINFNDSVYGYMVTYFNYEDTINEKILYDFNLNIGDTITAWGISTMGPTSEKYFYTILDIDTIIINDTPLKRLIVEDKEYYFGKQFEWIEGIGSNFGLITRFLVWDTATPELFCCRQNGEVIYRGETPHYYNNACCIQMGIDDVVTFDINIYPNPTTSNVNIDIENNHAFLIMFDMTGKIIQQKHIYNNCVLDLSNYPIGVYTVNLFSERGSISRRIIKL